MSKINWKKVRKNLYPHWQKAAPSILLFVSVIISIQASMLIAPEFTGHTAILVAAVVVAIFTTYRWQKAEDEMERMKTGADRATLELQHERLRHKEVEDLLKQFTAREREDEPLVSRFDGNRQEF